MGSPRPIWISLVLRKSGLPPSSWMPTSNDTRVRVLDLAKIIAHVWPASGFSWWPRSCLNRRARAKICATSSREKSVSERKCFMTGSVFLGEHRVEDRRRAVEMFLGGDQRGQQPDGIGAGRGRKQ